MSVQALRKEINELIRWEKAVFYFAHHPDAKWSRASQADTVTHWVNEISAQIERIYKVANAKKAKESGKVEFKGFVNYTLTDEEKENFALWGVDDHDLFLLIAGDNQTGYKLTMTFNSQNDNFQASYMCLDPESPNAGYILSAFAPDWYTALKVLTFKHNVVLDCQWNIEKAKAKNAWG